MKSRHLIVGASLCLAMIGTAGASTQRTSLGAAPAGDFGVVGHGFEFAQSFQGARDFNPAMASVAGSIQLGKYTFADLAPGSYTVSLFGASKSLGGYAATYKAAVAAVPEIDTWAMLLIGLGLAAYQLHRKQKSLGSQVLNDESMNPA